MTSRWSLGAGVLMLLGALSLWLTSHSPIATSHDWIEPDEPPGQIERPTLATTSPSETADPRVAGSGPAFTPAEQNLIRDCLKLPADEDVTSYDTFVQGKRQARDGNTLWSNVHLVDSTGNRRLVRTSTETSAGGGSYQRLQVAVPDAQGLPDFLDLKPSEEINPTTSTLNHYLSWGRPEFSESAEQYELGEGASLYVETENQEVREFIFVDREARSVSCSRRSSNPEQRCRCIR